MAWELLNIVGDKNVANGWPVVSICSSMQWGCLCVGERKNIKVFRAYQAQVFVFEHVPVEQASSLLRNSNEIAILVLHERIRRHNIQVSFLGETITYSLITYCHCCLIKMCFSRMDRCLLAAIMHTKND